MNKNNKIIILSVFVTAVVLFNACVKGDFDQPPVVMPHTPYPANMTIAQLNKYFTDSLHTPALALITKDIVIQGTVISSDEAGNIYKSLYIEDSTGGIDIALNQNPLYTSYKLGQRIYVKCKDLYIGNYKGVIELGYNNSGAIGQIPSSLFSSHLYLDSFPGKPPVPKIITIPSFSKDKISTLIKLDSVHFSPADTMQPFVQTGAQYGTNRTVIDKNGNQVVIYTSAYANFATVLVPKGTGCITAILSYYSGSNSYQLYLRDINDVQGFNK